MESGSVRGDAPIQVAELSEVRISGLSVAGIAGSNLAAGVDVCLFLVLCVVR
jgi:hypothetical protein